MSKGKSEVKKGLEHKQMCNAKLKDNLSLWNLSFRDFYMFYV